MIAPAAVSMTDEIAFTKSPHQPLEGGGGSGYWLCGAPQRPSLKGTALISALKTEESNPRKVTSEVIEIKVPLIPLDELSDIPATNVSSIDFEVMFKLITDCTAAVGAFAFEEFSSEGLEGSPPVLFDGGLLTATTLIELELVLAVPLSELRIAPVPL